MQERHHKREQYFIEQSVTTADYVIPFIKQFKELNPDSEILEIGCGEGGNLKPFLDLGCKVTGVDILETKISKGEKFFKDHPKRKNLRLIASDIYQPSKDLDQKYDIVFMRDVLEHIHGQEKFMKYVKRFLKADAVFFLGFPPWQNPFGGHQQMCHNSFLSMLPWFHLLPGKLYPGVLRLFNEPEGRIEDLLEIRETRISIERFRKIIKKENYRIIKEDFWFINPNYKIKFGLKPRKMPGIISAVPWIRNFLITTNYYLLSYQFKSDNKQNIKNI